MGSESDAVSDPLGLGGVTGDEPFEADDPVARLVGEMPGRQDQHGHSGEDDENESGANHYIIVEESEAPDCGIHSQVSGEWACTYISVSARGLRSSSWSKSEAKRWVRQPGAQPASACHRG